MLLGVYVPHSSRIIVSTYLVHFTYTLKFINVMCYFVLLQSVFEEAEDDDSISDSDINSYCNEDCGSFLVNIFTKLAKDCEGQFDPVRDSYKLNNISVCPYVYPCNYMYSFIYVFIYPSIQSIFNHLFNPSIQSIHPFSHTCICIRYLIHPSIYPIHSSIQSYMYASVI